MNPDNEKTYTVALKCYPKPVRRYLDFAIQRDGLPLTAASVEYMFSLVFPGADEDEVKRFVWRHSKRKAFLDEVRRFWEDFKAV